MTAYVLALSLSERIKVLTDHKRSGGLLGLPGIATVGAAAWVVCSINLEIQQ
jgi:hypothetical protein